MPTQNRAVTIRHITAGRAYINVLNPTYPKQRIRMYLILRIQNNPGITTRCFSARLIGCDPILTFVVLGMQYRQTDIHIFY